MSRTVRIPITNIYGDGDYTGRIYVGSGKTPLNVILDTGSSALAVDGKRYKPAVSGAGTTTKLAQTDGYADGSSWTGAVLRAIVTAGEGEEGVPLSDANVAVAYAASRDMFGKADGILGLAYAPLDDAFRMPRDTWANRYTATQVRAGKRSDLKPYLTQLAAADVVSDIISFYTRRSFVHVGGPPRDPLNEGWVVLGGWEQCHDLYTGAFQTVKVVSDDWYSTTLKEVIVGTSDPVASRTQGPKGSPSNSIVDSGTNCLVMSRQMFDAVLSRFTPAQQKLLNRSVREGKHVPAAELNLAKWPALTFVLEGETGEVKLKVAPSDYWQVNTDHVGSALAAISLGDPGFTILGLPLLNGYFTVFDGEAANGKGVIRFARRRA